MNKYDKKCHLYINAANVEKNESNIAGTENKSISENRDEFLAVIIG